MDVDLPIAEPLPAGRHLDAPPYEQPTQPPQSAHPPHTHSQVPSDPSLPPADPAAPPRRHPSSSRWWRGAAVLIAAALAGGAAGGVVGRATAPDGAASGSAGAVSGGRGAGSITSSIANPTDIQQVLAAIQPAVVSIKTQAYQRGRFFATQGAGSGFILTPDGEVLTNAHVVAGATSIEVTLNGERTGRPADLIGADDSADIALVKIRDASELPVATLGRSADLRVGDGVVAIGNALDLGATPTVTEGIVSALDRTVEVPGETLRGLIQTDAAINRGNSGGPLVDAQGRVVGVNTVVAGGAQNIGFALAIDRVKTVIDRLRSGDAPAPSGRVQLGVSVSDTDDGSGALVEAVTPSSPAAKAGLEAGDVIAQVDGRDVADADALVDAIRAHEAGDEVTIVYLRGGERRTATVELGS
jgi:putative serine protease PepD